jgi:hypothetical protein
MMIPVKFKTVDNDEVTLYVNPDDHTQEGSSGFTMMFYEDGTRTPLKQQGNGIFVEVGSGRSFIGGIMEPMLEKITVYDEKGEDVVILRESRFGIPPNTVTSWRHYYHYSGLHGEQISRATPDYLILHGSPQKKLYFSKPKETV